MGSSRRCRLSAVLVLTGLVSAAPRAADDPDVLYAQRTNLASATRAADVWAEALRKNPSDFEAAWKLARASYWRGTHGVPDERRRVLEEGVRAAETAARLRPDRPEGYYWQGADMGALAEMGGMRAGLRYRKPIKEALERARAIDPGYLQGSPDRALGRWYAKVPRLFGGSHDKAEQHLKASLGYNSQSIVSLFFLAELYVDENRRREAQEMLHAVLKAPPDPEWEPEDLEFKDKARALLSTLERR